MAPGDGFDPDDIKPSKEYTLQALARVVPYSVSSLRRAISDGELKARKKGRILLVKGRDFLRWWNT